MNTFLGAVAVVASLSVASFDVSADHHGGVLTDKAGMTLYTFDKDKQGKSACYGGCAKKWPPYLVGSAKMAKKGWATTMRTDGSMQWTYNGQPLYTWVGDQAPGDKTGDGVGGVWHIAKKGAAKPQAAKSSYGY